MGAAATRSWPLPLNTDLVRNLPAQLTTLADKIASDAAGEAAAVGGAGPLAGLAAAAGWTISAISASAYGRLKLVAFSATRTGASLAAAGAAGNIADTDVATLSGAWAPDTSLAAGAAILPFPFVTSAYAGHCILVPSSGKVTITDAYPTAVVANGDVLRFNLAYRGAA